jgi:hypothetical protein
MGMNIIHFTAVFEPVKTTVPLAAEYHFHPIEIPDQSS